MTPSAPAPLAPPEPPTDDPDGADETAREQVLSSLTPFFLDGAAGDPEAARAAAQYMLDGYCTATTEELQIAAQIIACGFAALDGLRRSIADKDLSVNTQLRLRGSANAMNRAVQQGRRALELRRQARGTQRAAGTGRGQAVTQADFQAAMQSARDAMAFARADFESGEKPRSYWRQRRADEREARLSQRRAAAVAARAREATAG